MQWQRWWLCWKIAKGMCYEFLHLILLINIFFNKFIAFESLFSGWPRYFHYIKKFFFLILVTLKTLHTYKIKLHIFHSLKPVLYSQYLTNLFCCHVQIISWQYTGRLVLTFFFNYWCKALWGLYSEVFVSIVTYHLNFSGRRVGDFSLPVGCWMFLFNIILG